LSIPKNASNTVYVEGVPTDATEREVAHIFRPFVGFKTVRLIPREKRQGERVMLCFADFENTLQTTIVINTLQGYRFDRDDIFGL
jgi:RNA recognition motif-containing protein